MLFRRPKPFPYVATYAGYQAYPRFLYHPKLAPEGRIFKTPPETIGLQRKGWVDNPGKFPKPSRLVALRPWWTEWEWFVKAVAAMLVVAAALVSLVRALIH